MVSVNQQDIIAEIESRAAKLKLPISRVCEAADVHPTTFSRWKLSEKNPDPVGATLKSLEALHTALDQFEDQKKRAA